jgi:transcriptional regulator with XRE-family HTH domain
MKAVGPGPLLRAWRASRGKTQLALAFETGISTKHLSFVETGRSNPTREMVLALAEHLEVPLRDRNVLLEAAGYAAAYRETPLDASAMSNMRAALAQILDASEPNPALAVNRRYDILLTNDAAVRLLSSFAPDWRGKNNIVMMLLSPDGLKPAIENWDEVALHVVQRVRTELTVSRVRNREDDEMLEQVMAAYEGLRHTPLAARDPTSILIPVKLRRDRLALDLFTMITTLGTPLDITLQEMRIETLFPAGERDREALAALE